MFWLKREPPGDAEFDIEHLAVISVERVDGETLIAIRGMDDQYIYCTEAKHEEFVIRFRNKIGLCPV